MADVTDNIRKYWCRFDKFDDDALDARLRLYLKEKCAAYVMCTESSKKGKVHYHAILHSMIPSAPALSKSLTRFVGAPKRGTGRTWKYVVDYDEAQAASNLRYMCKDTCVLEMSDGYPLSQTDIEEAHVQFHALKENMLKERGTTASRAVESWSARTIREICEEWYSSDGARMPPVYGMFEPWNKAVDNKAPRAYENRKHWVRQEVCKRFGKSMRPFAVKLAYEMIETIYANISGNDDGPYIGSMLDLVERYVPYGVRD